MAGAGTSFDSGHQDMVHDAQLDYYGRKLATCSSDRTIKVFDIVGDNHTHLADLRGHEGPVWQVCWAHPKFGSVLASCSFDHRVIVWKEGQDGQWNQVSNARVGSCNMPMCPGVIKALFGYLMSMRKKPDGFWLMQVHITAPSLHSASVNSICWAPHELGLILASASSDGTVSVMEYKSDGVWDTTKVRGKTFTT